MADIDIKVLQQKLSQAFDEGNESPYDLKEGIIRDILKEFEKPTFGKPTIPSHEQIVQQLNKTIPPEIKQIMLNSTPSTPIFLSGGSLIKTLLQTNAWNSDNWDFYTSWNGFENMKRHVSSIKIKTRASYHNSKNQISKRIAATFSGYANSKKGPFLYKIDTIVGNYLKPQDVVEDFDFTFLQCVCYYDAKGTIKFEIMNQQTMSDLLHNVIRLSPKIKTTNSDTKQRVLKYIKRGFRDCTGLVETGLLNQYCSELAKIGA